MIPLGCVSKALSLLNTKKIASAAQMIASIPRRNLIIFMRMIRYIERI